jgi:hypothetical protein
MSIIRAKIEFIVVLSYFFPTKKHRIIDVLGSSTIIYDRHRKYIFNTTFLTFIALTLLILSTPNRF